VRVRPNPSQVGTSGLLLCAKTSLARRALSMALQVLGLGLGLGLGFGFGLG
jgi:hypothetical protein